MCQKGHRLVDITCFVISFFFCNFVYETVTRYLNKCKKLRRLTHTRTKMSHALKKDAKNVKFEMLLPFFCQTE